MKENNVKPQLEFDVYKHNEYTIYNPAGLMEAKIDGQLDKD